MGKTLIFVHPDLSLTMSVPDELYDIMKPLFVAKLIRYHFSPTEKALRGNSFHTVIIDDIEAELNAKRDTDHE